MKTTLTVSRMKKDLILTLLIITISIKLFSQTYKQDSLKAVIQIKQYTKEIKRNPKDVDAYCNRGLAYSRVFNFDAAFEDCNKAIQLDSSNYKAFYYKGLVKTVIPNPIWIEEAIIAFTV